MGKANKELDAFIDKIPDEKLTGFSASPGKIYSDIDFRLDMQGMTTNSKKFNIQIQVNRETTIISLKEVAPNTVSHILVPVDATWTAARVRTELKAAVELHENFGRRA